MPRRTAPTRDLAMPTAVRAHNGERGPCRRTGRSSAQSCSTAFPGWNIQPHVILATASKSPCATSREPRTRIPSCPHRTAPLRDLATRTAARAVNGAERALPSYGPVLWLNSWKLKTHWAQSSLRLGNMEFALHPTRNPFPSASTSFILALRSTSCVGLAEGWLADDLGVPPPSNQSPLLAHTTQNAQADGPPRRRTLANTTAPQRDLPGARAHASRTSPALP